MRFCESALRCSSALIGCCSRRYVRSHLLSSDYEGCVMLWDVDTGLAVNEYEAHDKRIWSVDFCTADSSLFVSGSDDGWIKVRTTPCCYIFCKAYLPLSVLDLITAGSR